MEPQKPDMFEGRRAYGRWFYLCLNEYENWPPDLYAWCQSHGIPPTAIQFKQLGEYLVAKMPDHYGYLLHDPYPARLRAIFQWRDTRRVVGYPDYGWMAAIQRARFLFYYTDSGDLRRIGELPEDAQYLTDVLNGFIDPSKTFTR